MRNLYWPSQTDSVEVRRLCTKMEHAQGPKMVACKAQHQLGFGGAIYEGGGLSSLEAIGQ